MSNLKKGLALIVLGGAAVAAPLLGTGSASAYTTNADGSIWVGKGEVQTALGMNNAALQKAVDTMALTFTTSQSASQALSQSAEQQVTQKATVDVTRTVSCWIDGKKQDHVAYGTRDGSRTGHRDGVRTGSRTGSVVGNVVASVQADARKTGQWTGWNARVMDNPAFTSTSTPVWNDPVTLGDATFDGEATLSTEVTWLGWESAPGENPADCLRTNTNETVSDLVDNTVESPPRYADPVDVGGIEYGPTQDGAVTTDGARSLLVNGRALTPSV